MRYDGHVADVLLLVHHGTDLVHREVNLQQSNELAYILRPFRCKKSPCLAAICQDVAYCCATRSVRVFGEISAGTRPAGRDNLPGALNGPEMHSPFSMFEDFTLFTPNDETRSASNGVSIVKERASRMPREVDSDGATQGDQLLPTCQPVPMLPYADRSGPLYLEVPKFG